jgi:hypothetical protein
MGLKANLKNVRKKVESGYEKDQNLYKQFGELSENAKNALDEAGDLVKTVKQDIQKNGLDQTVRGILNGGFTDQKERELENEVGEENEYEQQTLKYLEQVAEVIDEETKILNQSINITESSESMTADEEKGLYQLLEDMHKTGLPKRKSNYLNRD